MDINPLGPDGSYMAHKKLMYVSPPLLEVLSLYTMISKEDQFFSFQCHYHVKFIKEILSQYSVILSMS